MAIDDVASQHRLAQTVFAPDHRPLRLILGGSQSTPLMPQRVLGSEAVCGGIEVRLLCVAASATLALKQFIGVPAELQIVTDRGGLRRICGIVTSAASGQSDGGLATYQLVMRDALSVMEHKRTTRVFRDKNELDIIGLLVGEWQRRMPAMAGTFGLHIEASLASRQIPPRGLIMQHGESDADFMRRLMQQRGIGWFYRPGLAGAADNAGQAAGIGHTLVLFDDSTALRRTGAGTVRFHRDDATEQRDTITAWSGVRELVPGKVSLHSWDYLQPANAGGMTIESPSVGDQGEHGTALAARLDDYLVAAPHLGENARDLLGLGDARMGWHEYAAKRFAGEGSVRDLAAGEWFVLEGHPEIDAHPQQEREFVVTAQQFCADNHLPAEIGARVERLFERSGWPRGAGQLASGGEGTPLRYVTRFTCVRRRIRIVPPPATLVRPQLQSAIVVGPEKGTVWCDELGRVKVQFPAARAPDHAHAGGAGSSGSERDSAWVRVASSWAGNGAGSAQQCGARLLPPVGAEVLVDFAGGHPDKPVIIGQVYNGAAPPPAFRREDALPASRHQSGLRSREVNGDGRGNQLRLDDTPGQISAQLASDHGASELNLGYLTEARQGGSNTARGEGAELRTDHALALRAARGILLSAWELLGGGGKKGAQLGRDAYLDLLRECGELCSSLGQHAAEHGALERDAAQQDALFARFRQWEAGSNTAPASDPVGEPVIALTSPAGIGFASSKAIVSYSATSIDSAALQHLHLTAGQRFTLNAGAGVSLFARSGGFKAIAHQGKLLLQSQHDDIAINAAKSMQLSASDGTITIAARTILLVADDGSFFRLGDGPPVLGSKGPLKFHATDFLWDGPETMDAHLPVFEKSGTDLVFEPRFYPHLDGGVPASGLGYRIDSAAGGSKGNVDDGGATPALEHEQMHLASIELREEEQP
jgi:type VI secretion system secreted protein VgrG